MRYKSGDTVGKITIIGDRFLKGNRIYYPTLCACGNKKDIREDGILANKTGCGKCKVLREDQTGKSFNGLVVTGFSHKKGNVLYWKVLCSCGKERAALKLQTLKKHSGVCTCAINKGDVFGKLTFSSRKLDERGSGGTYLCNTVCLCGNGKVVTESSLKRGEHLSCGLCDRNPVRFTNDLAYIDVSTEKHPYKEAIIDIEDYPLVKFIKWYASGGNNTTYAESSRGSMHRLIHDAGELLVDHIDQNGLNNTKKNLRTVDRKGNATNSKIPSDNTSGHMGVSWRHNRSTWRAFITVEGVQISLGHFSSFEDAVQARKSAEVQYGFHENHGRTMTNGDNYAK
jgi:hypothetical protein